MPEPRTRPSLIDDPDFLAGIEELERRLSRSAPEAPEAPEPPLPLPPTLRNAADAPIVLQPGSRRPLLDLFPLTPQPLQAPRNVQRRGDETSYGFAEPPFSLEPDLRFLYHSAEHDRVVEQVVSAIGRRVGVLVVTGRSGIGKTLLCKAVVEQLDRRTLTSSVAVPAASFDAVVQTLLADFGVRSRHEIASSPADRMTTLRSCLASLGSLHANAVIILDDAQTMAPEILRSLHALAGEMPGTLQLLLVGEPALTSLLQRPDLQPLNDHVALRLDVGPLAPNELAGYVMHRVNIASPAPHIEFDDRAVAILSDVTGGVPRAVNEVCDRAIALADDASARVIDDDLIRSAAAELGIESVPAPGGWRQQTATAAGIGLAFAAGAGAAMWIFHDRVQAILARLFFR